MDIITTGTADVALCLASSARSRRADGRTPTGPRLGEYQRHAGVTPGGAGVCEPVDDREGTCEAAPVRPLTATDGLVPKPRGRDDVDDTAGVRIAAGARPVGSLQSRSSAQSARELLGAAEQAQASHLQSSYGRVVGRARAICVPRDRSRTRRIFSRDGFALRVFGVNSPAGTRAHSGFIPPDVVVLIRG